MTNLCAEAGISFRGRLLLVRSNPSVSEARIYLKEADQDAAQDITFKTQVLLKAVQGAILQAGWVHHVPQPDVLLPGISHQPWPQGRASLCCSASAVQPLPSAEELTGLLSTHGKAGPVLRLQSPSCQQPCSCKDEEHSCALFCPLSKPIKSLISHLCHAGTLLPGFPCQESLWIMSV